MGELIPGHGAFTRGGVVLRTHVAGVAMGSACGGEVNNVAGIALKALGGGACLTSEVGAGCGKNSGEVTESAEGAV